VRILNNGGKMGWKMNIVFSLNSENQGTKERKT